MNLQKILNKIQQNYQIFGNLQNIDNFIVENISIDSRKIDKNTIFFWFNWAKK